MADVREIRPHPGPQTAFLSSPADIAIFGGSAGSGKTYGLLLEPTRHIRIPGFNAVFFRRNMTNHLKAGSTWDTSFHLYPLLEGRPLISPLHEWRWPGGVRLQFSHLEQETTVFDWHGSQIALEIFDELTEFTPKQFWYMLSRNRSGCGVRPYVRATCNPDPDSFLADLIAWWIDPETGYPIPERSGKLRWFVRGADDRLEWGDSREELIERLSETMDRADILPKSLTFIPAKLSDNPTADAGYRANLLSLPYVERERLLGGNWKIKPAAGLMFKRVWCQTVRLDEVPTNVSWVRGWDLAATPKTPQNDPDWTIGVLLGRAPDKRIFIRDARRLRETPRKVREVIASCARSDPPGTQVWIPQDPGQAGKDQAQDIIGSLAGFTAYSSPESGSKMARFGPFSAQAEAGNVSIVDGVDGEYLSQLEGFPDLKHDDDSDATSRAFNALARMPQMTFAPPIVFTGAGHEW